MPFSYAELEEKTQVAHSNALPDGTVEASTVRSVEPVLDSAPYTLPAFAWR